MCLRDEPLFVVTRNDFDGSESEGRLNDDGSSKIHGLRIVFPPRHHIPAVASPLFYDDIRRDGHTPPLSGQEENVHKSLIIMTTAKRFTCAILILVACAVDIANGFAVPSSRVVIVSPIVTNLAATTTTGNTMNDDDNNSRSLMITSSAISLFMALTLALSPLPSYADGSTKEFKLPPIDTSDKTRCVLNSSKMGQANAARDKLYDLRECNLSGVKGNEYDLSGVIMTKTDVSNAKFREAQFSKGYLRDSNFDGADFTNAIVDRANFKGSTLRGTIFNNAVLTATSFEGANVENADFTGTV
jgi:uncharacterized protein YjbI with pentapeptide repeats